MSLGERQLNLIPEFAILAEVKQISRYGLCQFTDIIKTEQVEGMSFLFITEIHVAPNTVQNLKSKI